MLLCTEVCSAAVRRTAARLQLSTGQQSIAISCRVHSSKPADVECGRRMGQIDGWTDRRTDGRTPYCYMLHVLPPKCPFPWGTQDLGPIHVLHVLCEQCQQIYSVRQKRNHFLRINLLIKVKKYSFPILVTERWARS